jgi:3-hydroxyacyl-[acyl-carrier-protein] dehydratase
MLGIKEILNTLPHRYPFLLVDRIEKMVPGQEIVGLKNVTMNEPFFTGHFPDNPIMPGVLIIEALAQVGGVLAYQSSTEDSAGTALYFMGIDRARFRKPVVPGDQLRLHLTMLRQMSRPTGRIFKMRGEAFVGESLVAEAELMAVIGAAPSDAAETGA